MDHAKYTLVAEPPSPRGIEEFHTDSPAFLLAKVDGDELLNLLESQPGTPFESPRLESSLLDDHDEPTESNDVVKSRRSTRNRKRTGPRPISGRPDSNVVPPKRIESDTQLQSSHKNQLTENAAALRDENEDESYLQGAWQDFNGVKWSVSHAKILYIVSLYTDTAQGSDSNRVWIRQLHLNILIYEGICSGVLSVRHSPAPTIICGEGEVSLRWLNLSSSGTACVNDLCGAGLLQCLRITDHSFAQNAAYQISELGLQFTGVMPEDLKLQIFTFLHGPHPFDKEILGIDVSRKSVVVTTKSGYQRVSSVRECERVPFVTSPYVPIFLRKTDKACTDNTAMASQCALWNTSPSENKLEAMCFGNITITLTEYLPVGPNMIESVSATLGARDRSSKAEGGSYMLPCRDKHRLKAVNFTSATMLDSEIGSHVNYEGSIFLNNFKNLKTRHIEEFGIHINQDGTIVCGVQIEAVTDRDWDDISPQLISKVIRELQSHSPVVVDNVYPEALYESLETLFFGKEASRSKYICLIADLIEPKLPAKQYLDKGKYQHELASIVGDVGAAEDLGDGDMVLFGSRGFFVIGPNSREHEPVCIAFASLMARNTFLDQFFRRASCLSDSLSELHELLRTVDGDQDRLLLLNSRILEASSCMRTLNSVLHHFILSMDTGKPLERPKSAPGRVFYDLLRFRSLQNDVLDRANDLKILLCRIDRELSCMTDLASFEERKNLERCFSGLQRQTLHLGREKGSLITHTGNMVLRSSSAVKLVIISFGGLLAADVLDRMHSAVQMKSATPQWFVDTAGTMNAQPYIMFFIQIFIVWMFCWLLLRRMAMFESRSVCFIRRKLDLNLKVTDMPALFKYLDRMRCGSILYRAKVHEHQQGLTSLWAETGIMHASFVERKTFRWLGEPPTVTLEVDVINGWIKSAQYAWGFWATAPTKAKLKDQLLGTLAKAGVTQEIS